MNIHLRCKRHPRMIVVRKSQARAVTIDTSLPRHCFKQPVFPRINVTSTYPSEINEIKIIY